MSDSRYVAAMLFELNTNEYSLAYEILTKSEVNRKEVIRGNT